MSYSVMEVKEKADADSRRFSQRHNKTGALLRVAVSADHYFRIFRSLENCRTLIISAAAAKMTSDNTITRY